MDAPTPPVIRGLPVRPCTCITAERLNRARGRLIRAPTLTRNLRPYGGCSRRLVRFSLEGMGAAGRHARGLGVGHADLARGDPDDPDGERLVAELVAEAVEGGAVHSRLRAGDHSGLRRALADSCRRSRGRWTP